jgi:hypothetical protein
MVTTNFLFILDSKRSTRFKGANVSWESRRRRRGDAWRRRRGAGAEVGTEGFDGGRGDDGRDGDDGTEQHLVIAHACKARRGSLREAGLLGGADAQAINPGRPSLGLIQGSGGVVRERIAQGLKPEHASLRGQGERIEILKGFGNDRGRRGKGR